MQVVAFDNMPKAIARVRDMATRMEVPLNAVVLDVKDVCCKLNRL